MKSVGFAIAFLFLATTLAFPELLLPNFVKQKKIESLEIDRDGVILFLKGFASGLEEYIDFSAVKPCIQDETTIAKHIALAIHYFLGRSATDIEKALKELAIVGKVIPKAIEDCKAAVVDFRTLIELIKAFENPGKFIWVVAKNLIVHGVEIWAEVQEGLEFYRAEDYLNSGEAFGEAMCKVFFDQIQATSVAVVNSLNAQPKLWQAAHYPRFENMTLWQLKKQYLSLASLEVSSDIPVDTEPVNDSHIPEEFDARDKWKGCIQGIRFQGHCRSGWAFGAAGVVGDRFCIDTNGKINKTFSPQHLVSCNRLNHKCKRGYLSFAWWFLVKKGIVTEGCFPYESDKGHVPCCANFTQCDDGSRMKFYHMHHIRRFMDRCRIKKEIMEHGPVETGFLVYEDFIHYKSGIYHRTCRMFLGIQAARIIGWGVEKGVKYWIVANSWSEEWGEDGYFRIREGECLIDFAPIAGRPWLHSWGPEYRTRNDEI